MAETGHGSELVSGSLGVGAVYSARDNVLVSTCYRMLRTLEEARGNNIIRLEGCPFLAETKPYKV